MNKKIYFDIVGGISGDMSVAALLGQGITLGELKKELKKIKVTGYKLDTRIVERGHSRAVKFDVSISKNRNFSYNQILRLIKASGLSQNSKSLFYRIYRSLFESELKVHGHKHDDMKFHEVGDIDSIIDIASVSICLDKLGISEILYSVIPLSFKIAPATFELLAGKEVFFTGNLYENITPTGAAVLDALGSQVNRSGPVLRIGKTSYGAGTYDSPGVSNVLRASEILDQDFEADTVDKVEANIDDMNPQFFEYVFERLFLEGALDCFITPVYMKKTRPGFLLTVLSKHENLGKIADIILTETTSTGLRLTTVNRLKLERKVKVLIFNGIKVRVKIIASGKDVRYAPEYDDCRMVASKLKLPLIRIYQEIKRKAEDTWRSQV